MSDLKEMSLEQTTLNMSVTTPTAPAMGKVIPFTFQGKKIGDCTVTGVRERILAGSDEDAYWVDLRCELP